MAPAGSIRRPLWIRGRYLLRDELERDATEQNFTGFIDGMTFLDRVNSTGSIRRRATFGESFAPRPCPSNHDVLVAAPSSARTTRSLRFGSRRCAPGASRAGPPCHTCRPTWGSRSGHLRSMRARSRSPAPADDFDLLLGRRLVRGLLTGLVLVRVEPSQLFQTAVTNRNITQQQKIDDRTSGISASTDFLPPCPPPTAMPPMSSLVG